MILQTLGNDTYLVPHSKYGNPVMAYLEPRIVVDLLCAYAYMALRFEGFEDLDPASALQASRVIVLQ